MKFFLKKGMTFTATVEADDVNGFWPEFQIEFKPPLDFEVDEAATLPGGRMAFLRGHLVGWSGLKCDKDAAAYLTVHHGDTFRRDFKEGDDVPFNAALLGDLHSLCLNRMYTKAAGLVPMGNRNAGDTAAEAAEKIAKN